ALTARMLAGAPNRALRSAFVADLEKTAEQAPRGARRWIARAEIAHGLAASADGDGAVVERALALYEQAVDEAEEASDVAWYRDASAWSRRWAEALEQSGQHAAARDAFRRSARNARRAGLAAEEVIEIELETTRLGIRHGGDIEAVEAALDRHIDELSKALE